MTENEMIGWHHWLDGHEFEQVAGAGDGQGRGVLVHEAENDELYYENARVVITCI